MALFGDGLLNGSPFYGGYEFSETKLAEPTGLVTFANLFSKLPQSTSTTKDKDTDTDGNIDYKKTYVTGTKGTRTTLKNKLDDVETDIQNVLVQMRSQFDKTKNPTPEQALKTISSLGYDKELRSLMAKKNNLISNISSANQDLQEVNAIDKLYVKDIQAKQELAVAPISGIYVPIGSDDKGNPLTYGKSIDKLKEADNVVEDPETGTVSIKSPEYSVYGMGVKQAGALSKKIDDVMTNAAKNKTGAAGETLDEVTGFIKGWDTTDNYNQLLNASANMKSKLAEEHLADLSARTFKYNLDNPNNILFDDVEKAAMTKALKDRDNLTKEELTSISKAQDKYLASYVRKELPTYRNKETVETLEKGLYGSGKFAETVTIKPEINFFKINENGTPVYKDAYSWNTSGLTGEKAISITIARETDAFNTITGEKIKIPEGDYWISQYEEVKGKGEKYKPYVVVMSQNDNTKQYRIQATRNAFSSLRTAKIEFDESNINEEYRRYDLEEKKSFDDTDY